MHKKAIEIKERLLGKEVEYSMQCKIIPAYLSHYINILVTEYQYRHFL